jgi:two-component system response regulator AtoC
VHGTVLPILVTDDEEALRHLLRLLFEREGYEVVVASDGLEALEVLDRRPDIRIVFTDIRMPRLDGTALLERLRGRGLFVVMMSAFGTTETAVEALSRGAWDYVAKPFRPAEVVRCVTRIREHIELETENARLKAGRLGSPADRFLGGSRQADEIRELVGKVAPSDSTVLVTGESGTGKELVALAIHEGSPRKAGPFVAINCGAIPSTLLESQLFGHDKGAFTGADRARGGVFEEADGGTLFLDEIGDMPQALQVGLLRVLEDHTVRRLGSDRAQSVDVRVVAATAKDLEKAVAEGTFRDDLFYRLHVVRLRVPPLRERRDDLPEIAHHLLDEIAARLGRPRPRLGPEALDALVAYDWPGNVRELRNALEHAAIVGDADLVPAHLPAHIRAGARSTSNGASFIEGFSIKENGARLERLLIEKALAETGGNRTQAARLLEISYKALVYKIRDYGLGDP